MFLTAVDHDRHDDSPATPLLHDFYLKTFNHRSKTYIHIEEENLPISAEDPEDYDQ